MHKSFRNTIDAPAVVAALFFIFGVAEASAQEPVCGMNTEADVKRLYDEIVGYWDSTESPGYMTIQGGPTMPAGSSVTQQIVMWTDDGVLIGSNAGEPAEYDVVFQPAVDEPEWRFRSREAGGDIISPTLSDSELEILVDCAIEDLPRLVGRAEVIVPTGVMHLTLRLVYLGEIGMYGIGEWETMAHGRKAIIRAPVTMTRDE